MASLKLISAALFATAVVAVPATARVHHVRHVVNNAAVVAPEPAFVGPAYGTGYHCVPAPRVGAFATQPWADSPDVPCLPSGAPAY
jgi:hypothetical protein